MVKAVVGANWGDEGKGKITDMLAQEADIIVRFQGGANAGHTIINNYGKFALHTLPSGVFYGHTTSIIGNGVALDIPVLMKEINSIVERDVPMPKILVSDRAQMVMSYHKNFDAYEEERLGGKSFGSTKSGIAPFYSDKYAKIGFQVSELFDDDLLKEITDMLAQEADIIVRFQGGANAGHTIINNYGKFALHTLPSGVFYGHTTSIIGNGVALDIPVLMKEINSIVERDVPMPKILVSDRAQMVMSYHKNFDAYEEERLGGKSFGSTKSGIAPFYSDKYAKIGFQVSELFDDDLLKEKVVRVAEQKNVLLEHLYHKPLINPDDLYKELQEYKEMIAPYVCDTSLFLHNAIKEGKNVLLEGQLGSLKDPDHGIYPMVTSSSTLAGYGAIGAGIPPYEIQKIVTVCKAYSSAVGAGAFVSEIFGDEADELRRRGGDGGEFGATTGRPRRMGWFDCVASKYGCRMQGTTDVAFTVLDVLGYLEEIPVCVGYEINGEVTTDFPPTHYLEKAKPVLKKLPGWNCDIRGIKKYEDLPENCRKYIEFVEQEIGYPITMVSNGPGREDIIYRESSLSK